MGWLPSQTHRSGDVVICQRRATISNVSGKFCKHLLFVGWTILSIGDPSRTFYRLCAAPVASHDRSRIVNKGFKLNEGRVHDTHSCRSSKVA